MRVFKFCTHLKSRQVYCGKKNKTAEIYFAFFFPFFPSLTSIQVHREICVKYNAFFRNYCTYDFAIWYNVVTDLLYYVKENQTPPAYSSLNFFIFLSLQFSNCISSLFSRGQRRLQSWNLVHTWTVGWCIMYTWIRLLVLSYFFIASVFFLSNSKTLINFVTFLLGLQKLKLDTLMGNGLIYCVHQKYGKLSLNYHQILTSSVWLTLFYRDKNKEKQRQEQLMNGEAKKRKPLKRPPKSEAWSHKKDRKERKKKRKEIKEKKRKVEMTENDIKELDDDFRMVKKLKKNKVSHLMTKPTKWHVRPMKTQISLGIGPVWSESSLSAWRKLRSLATH